MMITVMMITRIITAAATSHLRARPLLHLHLRPILVTFTVSKPLQCHCRQAGWSLSDWHESHGSGVTRACATTVTRIMIRVITLVIIGLGSSDCCARLETLPRLNAGGSSQPQADSGMQQQMRIFI